MWFYKSVGGTMTLRPDRNYSDIAVTTSEQSAKIPFQEGATNNVCKLYLTWTVPASMRGKTLTISWSVHKTGNQTESSKTVNIESTTCSFPAIPGLIQPMMKDPMLGFDADHAGESMLIYTMASSDIKSIKAYYTEVNIRGTIKGGMHSGGLVATAQDGSTNYIENCHVAADIITSGHFAGGIMGHASSAKNYIRNCLFDGTITDNDFATRSFAGGILGWGNTENNVIENCLEDGTYINFNHVGMNFAYHQGYTDSGKPFGGTNCWTTKNWDVANQVGTLTSDELAKKLGTANWQPFGSFSLLTYKATRNPYDATTPLYTWDCADTVISIRPNKMYRFYSTNDKIGYFKGYDDFSYIEVNKGWNRIGYVSKINLPLGTAMALYADMGQPGDVIKSQSQFAVLSEDAGGNRIWKGTLTFLRVGEGYMLKSGSDDTLTFTYPNYLTASRYSGEPLNTPAHVNDALGPPPTRPRSSASCPSMRWTTTDGTTSAASSSTSAPDSVAYISTIMKK